jgi:hypothetical protein
MRRRYYEPNESFQYQRSKEPIIAVDTSRLTSWLRKWAIRILALVILGLTGYILYLRPWEKRDACLECQVDTPAGQVSCAMVGESIKRNALLSQGPIVTNYAASGQAQAAQAAQGTVAQAAQAAQGTVAQGTAAQGAQGTAAQGLFLAQGAYGARAS